MVQQLDTQVLNIMKKNQKTPEDTTLGVFYPTIKWTKDKDKYIAISITSDAINLGLVVILSALVHEMVHGYCAVMNIEDMEEKNKKKHNEYEKIYAEMAKLEVVKNKKVGWGETYPTAELLNIFENIGIDKEAFDIKCTIEYTEKEKKKSGKKKKFKHHCPTCRRTAESKDGKPLICGVCNVEMTCEAPEEPADSQ